MFKLSLADNNQMDFVGHVLKLNNLNTEFCVYPVSLLKWESVNIIFIGIVAK